MKAEKRHCDAAQSLKEAGLNRTPQRVAVLDMLIHAERPITASDILRGINDSLDINRVTVYRIISCLKDNEIIREIPTHDGINHYEMACMHNPLHPHFYCRVCKTMYCLDPPTIATAWEWLAGPHDYTVEGISIGLYGLCRDCRRKLERDTVAKVSREDHP